MSASAAIPCALTFGKEKRMSTHEEFREIAGCGGKLSLKFDKKSGAIGLEFTHSAPTPAGMFQIGASLDGKSIEYWPLHGVSMQDPEPPSPMVSTLVLSDQQGLYGRTCPSCKAYFRTSAPAKVMSCPYCAHTDRNEAFTTKNQLQFIDAIRECYLDSIENQRDIVIDLDAIAEDLPKNRPEFVYTEEIQQSRFVCPDCRTRYDILGEYAGCPTCGKRNSLQVFEGKLKEIEAEFQKVDADIKDRTDREVAWEKLTRCISDFEAMARDLTSRLTLLPLTPRRRNDLERLNLQNIADASECLSRWLGFEIFKGITEDDRKFLVIMANRRHILTHNGGRVDQEYLNRSGDTRVRLHQKISVRSREIRRLISLLRKCSGNFFEDFESISTP